MLEYWQEHTRRFGNLDYERDPDGLANVCGPGQPLWLSEYLARFQRQVFDELLTRLGRPRPGATALDVGTGAGRWAKVLADGGYETTGIDLQGKLIEDNRRRFPELEFHVIAVQEYETDSPLDLVSSVTVLQHIPFDEQKVVVRRLREMIKPGGHAIVLEHIVGQSPHVFSRTVAGWRAVFRDASFRCVATRRYNYSPTVRSYAAVRHRLKQPHWTKKRDAQLRPEDLVARTPRRVDVGPSRVLGAADRALLRTAVAVDGAVEPHLITLQPHRFARDCGFLFRAS
jgi:2-polyprenyl-3-methyl-5-hydroxy-6-metoxy-1,4-benzoquinol methylase